ncbi:Coronin-like protein crn1 [Sorochytrium milnesiophthora]
MSRFVRASKYRHVFSTPAKREICYDNLKVSSSAWDTNLAKVNAKFLAVNWNASGGGAFAVINLNNTGKLNDTLPLFNGHTAAVLDTDFHPFNDHVIASASEDCKVMIWKIPENGLTDHISSPVATFTGHQRKVGHVLFHPTANNVLASSSGDFTIKMWDIEKGNERAELLGHGEIIQSLSWNWTGSQMVTTCKDKVLRVFDVRAKKTVCETQGHQGIKGSRAVWLGDLDNKIATTGFSRTSDRQVCVWDTRNFTEPVKTTNLDTSSGILMPHYDKDNSVLYLAGKGDGNIRYYEYEDATSELYYLSEYKSADPQRGICFMPKRSLNINENEIARAYKVHTTLVEPISFTVPRKADTFQADIFPDTIGDEPSLTADEFFVDGKTEPPKLINLEKGFKPTAKKEFVSSAPADQGSAGGGAGKEPSTEKELQEAYKTLRAENETLKSELAQKDIRIRQLEAQLSSK